MSRCIHRFEQVTSLHQLPPIKYDEGTQTDFETEIGPEDKILCARN